MIQYYSISFNRVLSPKSTAQVLAEIARVLASGGAFVSISHDKHREKLYEEHLPGCTCGQPVYISTGKGAHVYICLKS